MLLLIRRGQLVNIKIGKVLLQKQTKENMFCSNRPYKESSRAIQRKKSKLFVTFRPTENIKDEVSLTSGHDYKSSSVTASSGKRKYSFFSQKDFAWLLDDQEEKNFIKLMKNATILLLKPEQQKVRKLRIIIQ